MRKARERGGIHIEGLELPIMLGARMRAKLRLGVSLWIKRAVIREARKGRTEIVSKSGFTEEAIKHAERYRPYLKLIHGRKTVKPKRRKQQVKSPSNPIRYWSIRIHR